MTITFIGHGYVGLVTACVFADLGNTVYVIGRNAEKIVMLSKGNPLIFEPGLEELLKKNLSADRIHFTNSYKKTVPNSDVIFIAVGTPSKENGEADLTNVFKVTKKLAQNLGPKYTLITCKSTVPVGTNRRIAKLIEKNKPKNSDFDVASCPEFLREGTALQDTFSPDRIVIGTDSKRAAEVLLKLHQPLKGQHVVVGLESAEIIKYAANSILATKISFANLVSFLCDKTGADVEDVLEGIGLDNRIGRIFLYPGVGYGGSCFPKDVKALIKTGQSLDVDMSLLESVESINKQARNNFLEKILKKSKGKKIGVLGLAFKPNTDDMRDAPSAYIINKLIDKGYKIKVYDPEAMDNARILFKTKVDYAKNPYDAASNVDCLIILTEWNEFKQIDLPKVLKLMTSPLIVDGRNMYEPKMMKTLGFAYISVGRLA